MTEPTRAEHRDDAPNDATWPMALPIVLKSAAFQPSHATWAIALWIGVGLAGVAAVVFTLFNAIGCLINLRPDDAGLRLDPAGFAARRRAQAGALVFLLILGANWILSVVCPLGE